MDKETKPTLSIIMPTFNHEEELAVMIDSIKCNTYDNWELLAIDDGSEESTISLLQRYAQEDSRIRLICRSRLPKGAPTCRNIGIDVAQGKYLVFFDSDDYITPDCLGQRVQSIEAHPELDFMVFPSGLYRDGQFMPIAHKLVFGYKTQNDDIAAFARRELPFIVWNNIYRTSTIKKHSLRWDERLLSLQDADFNMTAITSGMKYDYTVCQPDYGYRISSSGSISKHICTAEHYKSHTQSICNAYQKIQLIYGHKYDMSLFMGVLHIYNSTMTGRGIDRTFSQAIANTLKQYSPKFCLLFKMLVQSGLLLAKFLPEKRSRQISMMAFLLSREHREKNRVRRIAISINLK